MLNNIIDRIRLPFRKEKELYLSLYKILGFFPKDIKYYKQALMHKSIMRREKGKPINNERLEFLGDAILGAVVGHIVYIHFDGKREGFLTNTRRKIVQRETLNKLASELGITDLILSSGHSSSHNSYLGGNAFEALVGAIYLDKGYKACMQFVEERILGHFINIDKVAYKEVNFKSKLIEWSQKNRVNVDYKVAIPRRRASSKPLRLPWSVSAVSHSSSKPSLPRKPTAPRWRKCQFRQCPTPNLLMTSSLPFLKRKTHHPSAASHPRCIKRKTCSPRNRSLMTEKR